MARAQKSARRRIRRPPADAKSLTSCCRLVLTCCIHTLHTASSIDCSHVMTHHDARSHSVDPGKKHLTALAHNKNLAPDNTLSRSELAQVMTHHEAVGHSYGTPMRNHARTASSAHSRSPLLAMISCLKHNEHLGHLAIAPGSRT